MKCRQVPQACTRMLDALALLEEARLEVLDLGLELLDARLVLGLERAVCARSGWAGRGCLGRGRGRGGHIWCGRWGEGPFILSSLCAQNRKEF